MRMLAIDDESSVLEGLRSRMSATPGPDGRPYDVVAVGSPNEALALVEKEHFDVVVTDMIMGGRAGGLDVVRSLSDKVTVTIVLTALGTVSNCVEAMRAGAWDYLLKNDPGKDPYRTLQRSIETAFREKSAHPEAGKSNPDTKWVQANLPELMRTYPGEVVAVLYGKVIDHGDSYGDLAERLEERYPFTHPTIVSIPDTAVEAIE
jgi:DNA-binding NtrC family response regulator